MDMWLKILSLSHPFSLSLGSSPLSTKFSQVLPSSIRLVYFCFFFNKSFNHVRNSTPKHQQQLQQTAAHTTNSTSTTTASNHQINKLNFGSSSPQPPLIILRPLKPPELLYNLHPSPLQQKQRRKLQQLFHLVSLSR